MAATRSGLEPERATKRAEEEYEETLRAHRERQRLSGVEPEIEIDWPTKEEIADYNAPVQTASKTSRLRAAIGSDATQNQKSRAALSEHASPITMREITDEDVDRLWDWLRADPL